MLLAGARNGFGVRGMSVDCTMLGIQYLQEHNKTVDIVVSGINKGTNFRQMIRYSGTVNAAKEALVYNIPAIAISTYRAIEDTLLKKGMSSIETIINFMCLKGWYRERAFGVNVNIVSVNKSSGVIMKKSILIRSCHWLVNKSG